jgi:ATP-dependent Clp protease ATP-binding subunit ClpA
MFERFTNESRRVVVLAQEEARKLNHNYIGTEHLLMGLLREGSGAGARALASEDITLEAVEREVEAVIGRSHPGTSRSRRGPRRPWSFRCARPCSSAIATSAPGTSCSG